MRRFKIFIVKDLKVENFIRAAIISIIVGNISISIAQDNDLDTALAASLGLSLNEYREGLTAEAYQAAFYNTQTMPLSARVISAQEKASQDYIRKLLAAENYGSDEARSASSSQSSRSSVQHRDGIHIKREDTPGQSLDILRNNRLSREYAAGEQRPILENFMSIFNYLSQIHSDSDVHILDNYVFGTGNNILHLLNVGNLYNIDNPKLTLAQVGQQMVEFVLNHNKFFATYKYLGTPVEVAAILNYLNNHFAQMDSEISFCPGAREVWSRAWTLAINLYNKKQDFKYIQMIFDQALEGQLTRGGCIQGRINRGFVGYVQLLGKAGVGIFK